MIAPGTIPPADSVLRRHQPYPGFAMFHGSTLGRGQHDLTVEEHQALGGAKRIDFDELDAIAAEHRGDPAVKRGNLTALGPRVRPLAYVVGPDVVLVAVGRYDATYGGWVRPGDAPRRLTGSELRADQEAERAWERRAQAYASALAFEAARGLRGAS